MNDTYASRVLNSDTSSKEPDKAEFGRSHFIIYRVHFFRGYPACSASAQRQTVNLNRLILIHVLAALAMGTDGLWAIAPPPWPGRCSGGQSRYVDRER